MLSSPRPGGPPEREPCATTKRWSRRSQPELPPAAVPRPNPWVGCVIVRDGEVIGAGATLPPGGAHAEVGALAQAGEGARGATAYVTLEPCSHHGRTPPCADALIAAGVDARRGRARRSRSAGRRRGPRTPARRGHRRDCSASAPIRPLATSRPYLHHRRTSRPLVVAKVATSIDGRVAAADGSSRWLTSELARAGRARAARRLAGRHGRQRDRAHRSSRPHGARRRVAARASAGACPRRRARPRPAIGPLFDTEVAPTLVVTTAAAEPGAVDAWCAAGAKVEVVAAAAGGTGVDLGETFSVLGREGVLQVLVEGGGTLLGSVLAGRSRAAARRVHRATRARYPRRLGARLRRPRHDPRRSPLPARVGARARPRRSSRLRSRCLMFTGIVEELGRVRSVDAERGRRAPRDRGAHGARRRGAGRIDRGQRLLPDRRGPRRRTPGRPTR